MLKKIFKKDSSIYLLVFQKEINIYMLPFVAHNLSTCILITKKNMYELRYAIYAISVCDLDFLLGETMCLCRNNV